MAFKGGFLLKPTETGVSALANLYLQGKQAIDKKQREYDVQAQKSVAELSEASAFTVTGINQYDNLMSGFGNDLREKAMGLKSLYDQRQISLSQLNASLNSLTSDAKIGSQYANVTKERLSEIKKGIEEERLSDLNLELPGFFKSKNSGKDVSYSNYRLKYIGDTLHMVRDYNYLKGDKEEIDQEAVPMSVITDPDRPLYNKIKLDDDIKEFVGRMGDRTKKGFLKRTQTLADGNIVYASITDPALVPEIKKAIETRIDNYGDRDLISIAHDDLGFQSTGSSNFYYKGLEKRAKRAQNRFTNAFGDKINVSTDDFILKRSKRTGEFYLDENQKEIVRSYLRDSHINAFDYVTEQKVIKTDPDTDLNLGKFYAGGATTDSVSDTISNVASRYAELLKGDAMIPLESLDTKEAEKLRGIKDDIFRVRTGGATASILSMNTPDKYNKALASSFPIKSFTGQNISSIDQIVSVMVDGDIKFLAIGPSNLATITTGSEADSDIRITTKEGYDESVSDYFSENIVRRLYTKLYDHPDFRSTADSLELKGSYKTHDEYAKALHTVIQYYAEPVE